MHRILNHGKLVLLVLVDVHYSNSEYHNALVYFATGAHSENINGYRVQ